MKYILVVLRLIKWPNKTTGEEESCYAWSSNMSSQSTILGKQRDTSVSFFIGGQKLSNKPDGITLWQNDMSDQEYQAYVDDRRDKGYAQVSGDPGSPDCKVEVISTEQYDSLPQDQRTPLYDSDDDDYRPSVSDSQSNRQLSQEQI
mgnify:CR=1 FL=1